VQSNCQSKSTNGLLFLDSRILAKLPDTNLCGPTSAAGRAEEKIKKLNIKRSDFIQRT
jgi:hypothetical protein